MAVLSAVQWTTLEPYCVLYAAPSLDPQGADTVRRFVKWLQFHGVVVLRHTPKWAAAIAGVFKRGLNAKNVQFSPLYASEEALVSTFLRLDLPVLGFSDRYLLYTDADVLFTGNVDLQALQAVAGGRLPKYILMGSESREMGPAYGNAGVMLYNLRGMRATYPSFLDFIFSPENLDRGLHFGRWGPGDQGAYNAFYQEGLGMDVVPYAEFNWRPYWKRSETGFRRQFEPSIVHFHGPKPRDYEAYLGLKGEVLNGLFGAL